MSKIIGFSSKVVQEVAAAKAAAQKAASTKRSTKHIHLVRRNEPLPNPVLKEVKS